MSDRRTGSKRRPRAGKMCVYVDVDEVMVEEWIAELGLDPADLRGSLTLVLRNR